MVLCGVDVQSLASIGPCLLAGGVMEGPSLELLEQDSKDSAQSSGTSSSLASAETASQPEYKVTEESVLTLSHIPHPTPDRCL